MVQIDSDKARNTKIVDMIEESQDSELSTFSNFLSRDVMRNFKEGNFEGSVYVTKLGHQKIWKPDKFCGRIESNWHFS